MGLLVLFFRLEIGVAYALLLVLINSSITYSSILYVGYYLQMLSLHFADCAILPGLLKISLSIYPSIWVDICCLTFWLLVSAILHHQYCSGLVVASLIFYNIAAEAQINTHDIHRFTLFWVYNWKFANHSISLDAVCIYYLELIPCFDTSNFFIRYSVLT